VSVDVVAELARPIALASVLEHAAEALKALLGLESVPELEVLDGRRADDRLRVPSGRRLSPERLATMVIGDRIPPPEGGGVGSLSFVVRIAGAEDRAFVTVIDLTRVQRPEPSVQAVVSPTRTCVGVVLATAVALGAAIAAGGEFVDLEIVMLDGVVWDPTRFIERARLSDGIGDLASRCEQFMRQFPRLEGWPKDRSAR
jgi:hypothetical protein